MPVNPSSTANLPCEQCGYLNEPERVYCHNCGSKLDRSLLPKSEEKKQETPEKARKRISKITNPQASSFGREFKALLKTVCYAVLAAAIIQIVRAPDGVPSAKQESTMRLVSGDMMMALESSSPRQIAFTEDEVNDFLKRKLKKKEGLVPGVEFSRAFVNLHPGVLRMNSEMSIWGYPVYSGVHYRLDVKDGKFEATIVGGNFGRLPVHPRVMDYADATFSSLWASLQPERKQMDKMGSVKIEDKRINLVTKGAAAVR
jgi:hypothetical protein